VTSPITKQYLGVLRVDDLLDARPRDAGGVSHRGAGDHARHPRQLGMRALAIALVLGACRHPSEPAHPPPQTIRCAVIGGMMETGFWPELVARYEHLTGNKVELAITGPKPVVIEGFRNGGIDLVTVHSSDAMVNLVADGLAVDPQPWIPE